MPRKRIRKRTLYIENGEGGEITIETDDNRFRIEVSVDESGQVRFDMAGHSFEFVDDGGGEHSVILRPSRWLTA